MPKRNPKLKKNLSKQQKLFLNFLMKYAVKHQDVVIRVVQGKDNEGMSNYAMDFSLAVNRYASSHPKFAKELLKV